MEEPILKLQNIRKNFPGINVLKDVNVSFKKGEIHSILGENGAGKSTLMNIIAGVLKPDSGKIFMEGNFSSFANPRDCLEKGIAYIHQELSLIPALSIAENIFLGHLPIRKNFKVVNWSKLYYQTIEILAKLNLNVNPRTLIRNLSTGQRQQVEIARALALNPKILIMDEPTSALSKKEIESLFEIVKKLSLDGLTVIFISHKLGEVMDISNRITVLRDGKIILTKEKKDVTRKELAEAMLGHELKIARNLNINLGNIILSVEKLSSDNYFKDITFHLAKGEIIGIAGQLAAGKTELLRAIYGLDSFDSGNIKIDGKVIDEHSPYNSIKKGIYLVTEDKKDDGLVLDMSISENITLPYLKKLSMAGFISETKQSKIVKKYINKLKIKTSSEKKVVKQLSGGNQQKVVLSRWLSIEPSILLLDQPTRGIDIGVKEEIYQMMQQLSESGVAMVFVATEIPELLRVCNRIYVMRNGEFVDEFDGSTCNENKIVWSMVGGMN